VIRLQRPYYNGHPGEIYYSVDQAPKIRFTAKAQLPGSITVSTGVLLGIWRVEWILTSISVLSEKGGQAKVGKTELAATNPDRALERPAIVI
jgi:hypothetical protein